MGITEKDLEVKKSKLPGAGLGLFTRKLIPKGTNIIEYKGKITTWKEVKHNDGNNGYIYYVKRNHVIDASRTKKALARYANDARGIGKVSGISNNAAYTEEGLKVFIQAKKDIPKGAEILVGYGPEYWEAIRHNIKLDRQRLREKKK